MVGVRLSTHARRAYEKLARSDQRLFARVDRALDRVAGEPGVGKPLQGPLWGRRSHRVGPMRIIYRFDEDERIVLILDIAPRQQAYKRRR